MKQGRAIIVSAPSGAGKTTLVHHLLERMPQLQFSVSACTRIKRSNEADGRDYYFMSPFYFKQQIEEDAFVEWEEVYPNQFYGTLKSELDDIWSAEKVAIFDVDVRGALRLKKALGQMALSIFVMPPSEAALKERLQSRRTESDSKLRIRLSKAHEELELADRFDCVLVNDELTHAKAEIEHITHEFLKA